MTPNHKKYNEEIKTTNKSKETYIEKIINMII